MGGSNMPGVMNHLHAELTFIQPTFIMVQI